MNFKILFIYLISTILFFGCGVKAKPLTPPDKAVSSYIDSYVNPPAEKKN